MSKISYILDENVNPILRAGLLREKADLTVWQVGMIDVPPLGTLDPEILVWCEDNEFIVVTNNRKSMPVHLKEHIEAGRNVPGIFILNADLGLSETITELLLIAAASTEDEYQDQIVHLPIKYRF